MKTHMGHLILYINYLIISYCNIIEIGKIKLCKYAIIAQELLYIKL